MPLPVDSSVNEDSRFWLGQGPLPPPAGACLGHGLEPAVARCCAGPVPAASRACHGQGPGEVAGGGGYLIGRQAAHGRRPYSRTEERERRSDPPDETRSEERGSTEKGQLTS